MTPDVVIDLFRSVLQLILLMVIVIVSPGLFVGLIVSFFQALTQMQEQSLSFIPKLIVTFVMLMACGTWLLTKLLDFTLDLVTHMTVLMS